MHPVNFSVRPRPASFAGVHSLVVAEVKSSAKGFVEASIDDIAVGKEVAIRSFDPKTYRRKEVCFTIFQVDEVQNALYAVSRKQKDDLLKSLRVNKYQSGAELMILGSHGSGRLGGVNVRSRKGAVLYGSRETDTILFQKSRSLE